MARQNVIIIIIIIIVVVEALRYKPEGRGFDCRWRHWIFSLA
jgi:hypothetical protein